MKLLSKGNSKLHKSIGIFDIPAGMETCGRTCNSCYAIKAQVRFPLVTAKRNRNLAHSKTKEFQEVIKEDLGKISVVRVHSSGDFFSQEYVDSWYSIAKSNPQVTFYAYTKRYHEFTFSKLKGLSNFVLHNSLLDKDQVNYSKYPEVLQEKYGGFICPATTGEAKGCGHDCNFCMIKDNEGIPILFKQH